MDIKKIIIGKVKAIEGGSGDIWDEENNHIADARGWGRFQYMEDGDKIHDSLTQFIADAINEKLEREELGIKLPKGQILIIGSGGVGSVAKSLVARSSSFQLPVVDDLPVFESEHRVNTTSKKHKKGKHFTKRFKGQ